MCRGFDAPIPVGFSDSSVNVTRLISIMIDDDERIDFYKILGSCRWRAR